MIINNSFKQQLDSGNRNYQVNINITLSDSTILPTVVKEDLFDFSIESAVSEDNNFTALGSVIIDQCKFTLNNIAGDYSSYEFKGATVTVQIGLNNEYIDKGVFVVSSAEIKGLGIQLTCLDYMSKFDKSYTESQIILPTTIQQLVNDACTVCDVTLAGTIPYATESITSIPVNTTSFRQLLSYIGQITGTFVHVNRFGQLQFSWFDKSALNSAISSSSEINGVHYIEDVASITPDLEDITITGVKAYVYTTVDSESTLQKYIYGTDEFCLDISNNPFIDSTTVQTVLNRIGPSIVGLTYRKLTANHLSNPLIECGDVAMILGRGNVQYPIVVGRTVFAIGGYQETVCGSETISENITNRREVARTIDVVTSELQEKIDDARKVATNYLTFDVNTGLDVGFAGTNAKTRITGSGVRIYNEDNDLIASFGPITTIGSISGESSYFQIQPKKITAYSDNGGQYFAVGDLRGTSVTDNFIGNGSSRNFSIFYPREDPIVYVDGTLQVVNIDFTYTNTTLTFTSAPADGSQISITYIYDALTWYTTFGNRSSGSKIGRRSFVAGYNNTGSGSTSAVFGQGNIASGVMSFAEGYGTVASGTCSHASGEGTIASSPHQMVIGSYNDDSDNISDPASLSTSAFVIGNGTSSKRFSVFTVQLGGDIHSFGKTYTIGGSSNYDAGNGLYFYDSEKTVTGAVRALYKNNIEEAGVYLTAIRPKNSLQNIYNGVYLGIKNDNGTFSNTVVIDAVSEWRTALSVYSKTESDNRYVNVTGDTMTGLLAMNGANISIRSTNIAFGTTPSASTAGASQLNISDSNGNIFGWIRPYYQSNGATGIQISGRYPGSTVYNNVLTLVSNSSGEYGIRVTDQAAWRAGLDVAITNHASANTTYGVGTTANYGHCRTINNLTTSSHTNGYALSAYQGYVLNWHMANGAFAVRFKTGTISLADGTSGAKTATINLTSTDVPSGYGVWYVLVALGNFLLPYHTPTNTARCTYVSDARAASITITNTAGAWSNYTYYLTIILKKN